MSAVFLMISVVDRKLGKRFENFYNEQGLEVFAAAAGSGTAVSEVTDYLGIDGSEKSVIFHLITPERWPGLKSALRTQMNIDAPGVGVAFLVPLSSIGGKKTLDYLLNGQSFEKKGESTLTGTNHELLTVIVNQGYSESVMQAAKRVCSVGGTIIHAKGAGANKAEHFLGVSLVAEKEIVLIVVKSELKNEVMRAIMDKAGIESKARSMIFSLPVTATAGMRPLEELPDED